MILLAAGREFDRTGNDSIERIVGSLSDALTGDDRASGLANEDTADFGPLAIKKFHATVLRSRIASQLCRSYSFCMRHSIGLRTLFMLSKILKKVNEHALDLFVVFSVACIALISYNLGRIRALEKTPVTVRQDATLIDSLVSPQTDVYQAGERVLPTPRDQRVVASKTSSSKKYHYTWCAGAKQIKPENQLWFPTAAEAQGAGYSLAGNCQ